MKRTMIRVGKKTLSKLRAERRQYRDGRDSALSRLKFVREENRKLERVIEELKNGNNPRARARLEQAKVNLREEAQRSKMLLTGLRNEQALVAKERERVRSLREAIDTYVVADRARTDALGVMRRAASMNRCLPNDKIHLFDTTLDMPTVDASVDELPLSARALNVLHSTVGDERYRKAPIVTVGDLLKVTREDLLRRGGCGKQTAAEIMAVRQAWIDRSGARPST